MRLLAAGALALSACAAQAADGPLDFVFTSEATPAGDAAGQPRAWRFAEMSALRRVPREPGSAANAQPVVLELDPTRRALQSVEWGDSRKPLFSTGEAQDLASVLVRALAVAGADEDLLLASTARREGGVLVSPTTLTARVFMQDGRLQLIVREARAEVYGAYRASRVLPPLAFGSRQGAAAPLGLRSVQGSARRSDWLALDLQAGGVPAAAPAAAAAVAPAAVPAAAAVAAPAAAAPAPRTVRDAAFFDEQAQRLAGLKRLRDQGLLSEQEYEQKRRQIIDGL